MDVKGQEQMILPSPTGTPGNSVYHSCLDWPDTRHSSVQLGKVCAPLFSPLWQELYIDQQRHPSDFFRTHLD